MDAFEDVQIQMSTHLDETTQETLSKVCEEEISPFYDLQTEWFQLKYIKQNFPYVVSTKKFETLTVILWKKACVGECL